MKCKFEAFTFSCNNIKDYLHTPKKLENPSTNSSKLPHITPNILINRARLTRSHKKKQNFIHRIDLKNILPLCVDKSQNYDNKSNFNAQNM